MPNTYKDGRLATLEEPGTAVRSWDYGLIVCRTVRLAFALSGLALFFAPIAGAEMRWLDMGVRVSLHATEEREHFDQYELFANHGLPWSWHLPKGWDLTTKVEVTAGALDGGGKTGLVTSLGPGLLLTSPNGRFAFDGGSSAAFLSRDKFGRQDFGLRLQFISHAGVRFKLTPKVGIGYRYQHMSNASISAQNPGLDLHMLELSFHF
jgi:lipid A 3-O-deacylase